MNREQLIAAMQATADNPPRLVTVPGWGDLYVRDVTVAEIEFSSSDPLGDSVIAAVTEKLVADGLVEESYKVQIALGAARVICDESGHRIYNCHSVDDVYLLARQPWKLLRLLLADSEEVTPSGN